MHASYPYVLVEAKSTRRVEILYSPNATIVTSSKKNINCIIYYSTDNFMPSEKKIQG